MKTKYTNTIIKPTMYSFGSWERKDGTEGGEITIYGDEVVDFDGAYDLPDYVKNDLAENGIRCDW